MDLTGLVVAVAAPVAGVLVTAGLTVASGELDLPIGMEHVTGGVVAYLIIAKVLDHLEKRRAEAVVPADATDDEQRLEVQREIVVCLKQQTGILERMEAAQNTILEISKEYKKDGVCPLTVRKERKDVLEDFSAMVHRPPKLAP